MFIFLFLGGSLLKCWAIFMLLRQHVYTQYFPIYIMPFFISHLIFLRKIYTFSMLQRLWLFNRWFGWRNSTYCKGEMEYFFGILQSCRCIWFVLKEKKQSAQQFQSPFRHYGMIIYCDFFLSRKRISTSPFKHETFLPRPFPSKPRIAYYRTVMANL